MRRREAGRLAVATALVGLLATGCGIRDTSVPVDAGSAPTRASCSVPDGGRSSQSARRVSVRFYMVCASQVRPVVRGVLLSDEKDPRLEPMMLATELLAQLKEPLQTSEKQAGFSTMVEPQVKVINSVSSDPDHTIRLNIPPEQLRSYGLVQLICTYGHTTLGDHGKLVLGGPPRESGGLRRYQCTDELRSRPETVLASGVAVPSATPSASSSVTGE